ncbi:MAG: GTP-binding protein [Candidatus Heimdallarchaeota archaeon]|nr:GTP-binding protein [Candidatus Heimdallarchaeota archaeon]MCK5049378.1 GTP-binding protein [Candidatus Heimdallarchaeota archaeon]
MSKVTLKIIVVGNGNVGKTALSTRFTTGGFRESYVYTIGANFLIKTIDVEDKTVKLTLWDTAGQERYGRLLPKFFQNSDGAIIVYDQLDKTSFLAIDNWVDKINRFAGDIPLVIVANKADLENPVITLEQGITKAAYHSASFLETSAKDNFLVEETFYEVSQRCFGKTCENLMEKHERIEIERAIEETADDEEIPSSKVMTMPIPSADLPPPSTEEPTQESEIKSEVSQELEEHQTSEEIEASTPKFIEYPEFPDLPELPDTLDIPSIPKIPTVPTVSVDREEETMVTDGSNDLPEIVDDGENDTEDEQLVPDAEVPTAEVPTEPTIVTEQEVNEILTNEIMEEPSEIHPETADKPEELVDDGEIDEYVELEPEISEDTDIPEVVSKDQWPQIKQRFESVSTFIEDEPQIKPPKPDEEEDSSDKILEKVHKEEIIPEEDKTEDPTPKQLDLSNLPSPEKDKPITINGKKPPVVSGNIFPFSTATDSPQSMNSLPENQTIEPRKPKIDYFDKEKQSSFTPYRDDTASKIISSLNKAIESREERSRVEKSENKAIRDWLEVTTEESETDDQSTSNEEE